MAAPLRTRRFAAALLAAALAWTSFPPAALAAIAKVSARGSFGPHLDVAVDRALKDFSLRPASLLSLQKAYLEEPEGPGKAALGAVAWLLTRPQAFDAAALRAEGCAPELVVRLVETAAALRQARLADPALDASAGSLGNAVQSRVAKEGFIASVAEAIRLFAQDAASTEADGEALVLPASLAKLQPYVKSAAKEGPPAVDVEPVRKIDVAFKGGPLAGVAAFGYLGAFEKSIKRIIDRLAIEGDKKDYTVTFSASPMPGASIYPAEARMQIMAGLLPLTKTEDELAAVIAHEMTHANPAQLKAQETSLESQKVLDSLSGYQDLDPAQREEIRADLGAVQRLIAAGYNPWGHYHFLKRVTAFQGASLDMRLIKALFRRFFRRSFNYLEEHPAGELRMAAVKAYILDRGFKEDISELTKTTTQHPLRVRLLRARVQVYSLPVTSIWAQRALYGYALYRLGVAIVGWVTGQDASVVEAAVHEVLPEDDAPSAWSRFWSWFADQFPEGTGRAIGRSITYLVFTGAVLLQSAVIYVMIVMSNSDYYKQLQDLNARSATLRSTAAGLQAKGKLDAGLRLRLLKLNHSSLIEAEFLYLKAAGIRVMRHLDGLRASRVGALARERELLAGLAADFKGLPEKERARWFADLDPMLSAIPGFAVETPRVRAALEALLALRPGGPGTANRSLELFRRAGAIRADTPAEEALRLVGELEAAGMRDTASVLLRRHYFRIVRRAFSRDNPDPESASILARVHASLRQEGSLKPTGFLARRAWDARLLAAYFLSLLRARGEAWGVASLASEVPLSFHWLGLRAWVERAQHLAVRRKIASFSSVSELRAFVDGELAPSRVLLEGLTDDFYRVLLSRPDLVRSREDLDALIAGEHFWPKFGGRANEHGQLEGLFLHSLKRFGKRFPELWKFEPGSSERLHALYLSRMKALGLGPKDDAAAHALWLQLTSRGVTSSSDELFAALYERAPGLRDALEAQAIDQGRVWEQDLKARIVERRMKESAAYKTLLNAPRDRRGDLLAEVLGRIQLGLPERGLQYLRLLEELSREMRSSEEESRLIESAKVPEGGERDEDLGLRVMSDVLDSALGWWKKDQWRLILFLRGDIEPTRKIRKAFKTVGPERVRRMFQLLPSLSRAGVLDAFLDSPQGLAGQVTPGRGYSKTIIDHVLPADEPKSKKVALEVLEGFLYSLKKTGNGPLQSYVLSYLLSRPRGPGSSGETLKEVLELFGATGVKIGQFLAASQILPEAETKALRSLQDRAKVPDREAIYSDLREIAGERKLPVELENLLGAASIKYAVLAKEKETQDPVVLKIFRLDAIAHTRAEFDQIEAMADYLVRKKGPKYGVFRSIVKASRRAVERELEAEHEVAMGRLARKTYPKSLAPPQELLLDKRLIASQFAPGTSIYGLSPKAQAEAATRILELEGANLFADAEVIRFDPDRHPGNYRVKDGVITPIDFGQFLSITRAQREQVFELFALAQVLRKAGSSRWAAAKAAAALGLEPGAKLEAALGRYFPAEESGPVAAYYSLLAAVDETGVDVGIVYFDFVRAVIQLGQYEELTSVKGDKTPTARLEAEVAARAKKMAEEIELTPLEKLRYALRRLGG